MPKFIIQEVKEIVLESEIEAKNALEAISIYKRSSSAIKRVTEDSHIDVEQSKEGIEIG